MRLVYVCADRGIPLDGSKGASVHVRQTVGALRRAGVDVTVAAARPGSGAGLDAQLVPPQPRRRRSRHAVDDALAEIAAARALVDRTLETVDGPVDAVYERLSLWSLAGVALAERLDAPFVLEINAPLVEEASRWRGLALTGLAREIEATVVRSADAVVCVSSPLCGRAERIRGGAAGVHLFTNPVDLKRFAARPAGDEAAADAPVTVAFVGSLKPWHGTDDLVVAFARAWARQPRLRLLVIGDGPEREGMERLAARHGVAEVVEFTGPVPHDEVARRLAAAEIGIAPYPPLDDFYFSPMKLAEYCAAGLAVVATSAGDLDGLLEHGTTALRVAPGDRTGLADALVRLAEDAPLRARLGAAARSLAESRLSLDAETSRLLALVESLRGRRAAGAC
ncbi:MAG: glycosyltransferase family 4 protein [Acidobacteriota bacterium]